jgi:GT2 family glycosyltransferase
MSLIHPSDPLALAGAVVDSLVLATDPQTPEASIFYWDRGGPYLRAVVDAALAYPDPAVAALAGRLMADTRDPSSYLALRTALADIVLTDPAAAAGPLFVRAWDAESNCRLGIHLGARYRTEPGVGPVSADALRSLPTGAVREADGNCEVLVVVPFRDQTPGRNRLRNLLACLAALRDQSAPRDSYRVAVVETDEVPRWREVIEPYVEHYLFAEKGGLFNKAWAVNVGVVNCPGGAEVVCVLDADVLADRDFIVRNATRFRRPGTMGHLSYRDMWCLDEPSTAYAIEARLRRGEAAVDPAHLRAFVLRRPPGCCVWVRTSAYGRIGGMDERFEGWGGEDNDFAYRMDINSAFDQYDDPLLHMYHPSSSALREDGELINAHVPALSWRPDGPIGDLHRFARRAGAAAGV